MERSMENSSWMTEMRTLAGTQTKEIRNISSCASSKNSHFQNWSSRFSFKGDSLGKNVRSPQNRSRFPSIRKVFFLIPFFFYAIDFQDSNDLQEFEFGELEDFEELQIVFNSSTDFYGRVIVYQLNLIGS